MVFGAMVVADKRYIWGVDGTDGPWPSMRPVNPMVGGGNPITLIENMTRSADGSMVRRSGFDTTDVLSSNVPQIGRAHV